MDNLCDVYKNKKLCNSYCPANGCGRYNIKNVHRKILQCYYCNFSHKKQCNNCILDEASKDYKKFVLLSIMANPFGKRLTFEDLLESLKTIRGYGKKAIETLNALKRIRHARRKAREVSSVPNFLNIPNRLYPLSKTQYDAWASRVWEKRGCPMGRKRKVTGVRAGDGEIERIFHSRIGLMIIAKRIVGVKGIFKEGRLKIAFDVPD